MHTWLFLDLGMVIMDWAEVLFFSGASSLNATRMGKTIRSMRMLKMVRMTRLLRMTKRLPQVVNTTMEKFIRHDIVHVAMSIVKILLFFVWFNHLTACLFYHFGDTTSNVSNWIDGLAANAPGKEYIYMSAFHWSLTNFSGAMEVHPWNMTERTFAALTGVLKYMHATHGTNDAQPGDWACEPGLWTTWVHHGTMTSRAECTLLVLDIVKFQKISSAFKAESLYAGGYAYDFVSELNRTRVEDFTDLKGSIDVHWLAGQNCPKDMRSSGNIFGRSSLG